MILFFIVSKGGLLIIHDFMMEEGGPAASWLLAHQAVTPGSPALTASWVEQQMIRFGVFSKYDS